MLKTKRLIIALMLLLAVLLIPNMVNAAVDVTRNIYSNNGSMKFNFTGLTLDTTHEYEYGLTKTTAAEVETWHLITEYTETTAVVDVMTTTSDLRNVINAVDTGYITIKDKTLNTVVLQPYSVDLKTPYLNVTNYTVIPNGKDLNSANIQIALRCASNSKAYYQYEKITDQNIINKYKEIKARNGDVMELESMLKTTAPNSNWTTWGYWNGYDSFAGMNGYGYTQRNVSVPDSGLYYMWVYFSGNNLKNIYGYILVDNLQPEIALESISLPTTKTVELGKTITLTPTFNPLNATNKIVTWSSSDESVATIDNAGKITPKKAGSTIITAISQDGNKKATCTVTVTKASNNATALENHKYSIIEKSMSWEEAKAYCESLGGHLATITSKEEQALIEKILNNEKYKNRRFWLGATDEANEGKWKWVTGEAFDYSNWGEGEPDNLYGGQNYLVIENRKVTGPGYVVEQYEWDDIASSSEYFICEWDNNSQAQSTEKTNKDTTTAKVTLPNTGKVLLIWIIGIVAVSGIVAHIRYKKLYK